MGKSDVTAYETQIKKLCETWVTEVVKELKQCRDAIDTLNRAFAKKVDGVKVPKSMDESEVEAIPDRINQILKENSTAIKALINLEIEAIVDPEKKDVRVKGWGYRGKLLDVPS